MEKTLNKILVSLIFVILILLGFIIILEKFEDNEKQEVGLEHITGSMVTYEIYEGKDHYFKSFKVSKRFDDKYYNYLEQKQKARDKTFLR